MEEDDIGIIGGENLYIYAFCNPIIFYDELGLAVGSPGTWEGMIPIWGSGRSAINQFQHGNIICGLFNTGMAISDVFLVKALVTGVAKGALKVSGSFAWKNVRKWYGKEGFAQPFQPVHHWAFGQRGSIGKYLPDWLKNQPWNLMPLDDTLHSAIHYNYNIFQVMWYGTPQWFKSAIASIGGRISNLCKTDECE